MNNVIACRGDYQNDSMDGILRVYHRQFIEQLTRGINLRLICCLGFALGLRIQLKPTLAL